MKHQSQHGIEDESKRNTLIKGAALASLAATGGCGGGEDEEVNELDDPLGEKLLQKLQAAGSTTPVYYRNLPASILPEVNLQRRKQYIVETSVNSNSNKNFNIYVDLYTPDKANTYTRLLFEPARTKNDILPIRGACCLRFATITNDSSNNSSGRSTRVQRFNSKSSLVVRISDFKEQHIYEVGYSTNEHKKLQDGKLDLRTAKNSITRKNLFAHANVSETNDVILLFSYNSTPSESNWDVKVRISTDYEDQRLAPAGSHLHNVLTDKLCCHRNEYQALSEGAQPTVKLSLV